MLYVIFVLIYWYYFVLPYPMFAVFVKFIFPILCLSVYECVSLIALGKWRKMDLDAEDAERFDRRRRNNWSGVDSVYDAYLLCEEVPQEQFDYDLLLKRYPGWPKAWEHRYGPNGIFKEQSNCSDEVHYSKESESEEIVSERLKSSQIQRSPGKKANRRKKKK